MKACAEELGYRLEEHAVDNPDLRTERLRKILLARGVRGLIISPMLPVPEIMELDFSDFAVIALRLGAVEPSVNRVAPDYFSIASNALDKLWDSGHRKIAFFSQAKVDEMVRHRSLAAYLAKRYVSKKHFLEPKLMEDWSFEDFKAWFVKHKPDAIIASVHLDYMIIRDWLRSLNVPIPESLSVINLDCHADTSEAGFIHDHELEARYAIKLLVSKVESADFGIPRAPIRLSVPGIWRNGDMFAPRS
ncbi:substrate-binding domain-containing protein [Cerasicoccus fimbriatus]|uniref:substrate-binding domain-containing protein n=1 Tax=Cerasicoccus fimbriatus TaxID=3014554 RepID=UPI0022B44BD5|nr:substrate-binding domain-containing protein [Cerasicoccus sp. TK19100]